MPTTHPEREQVAIRVKAAMEEQEITLNALADQTGIPASSLSRYLRALTSPTIDHLALIAEALSTPLADLMPASAA